MADLLRSLVLQNSSQESFHSLAEHPSPTDASAGQNQNSAAHQATSQSPSQSQLVAHQAIGLPIYGVDAYLAVPENAALLHRAPDRRSAPTRQPDQEMDPAQPISLGSTSNHHMTALNILCQQKGLLPSFQIDGENSDFGGLLKIEDFIIASDKRWRSKKEAKEALAKIGLDAVKGMAAKKKEPGTPDEKDKNWIGMLNEYHQSINPEQGPVYRDFSLGSSYSSTCTIPRRPNQPFGSKTAPFSSKKAARANGARLAIEYLIAEGQLNADGSVKARQKVRVDAAVKLKGRGLEVRRGSTYAQKVNDAFPILGLPAPQYVLGPASDLAPNMISGYALFPNQPGLPKEIGEVRNIYGKKKAKEEIARGLWQVMQELAAQRGASISETDGPGEDDDDSQ